MKQIKEMNEAELRGLEPFYPKTLEELNEYITSLTDRKHDYGTCVYAMSLASLATFNFVASQLGVTGFQASCADLEFIGKTRGMKDGFRIIDYNKLLYPQYFSNEHFPTIHSLLFEQKAKLQKRAKELLETNPDASETVRKHWEKLAKD
jgi:hypothetical protein